jgi:hypothetical protein
MKNFNNNFLSQHKNQIIFCVVIIFLILFLAVLPMLLRQHYFFDAEGSPLNSNSQGQSLATTTPVFLPSYIATPEPLKGIYMTSWTAGTPSLRDSLVKLIDDTELNALVIDIKDYSGKIVFPVTDEKLKSYGSEDVRVKDLQDFVQSLHLKGIYVIGRIAVFQDAYFVKHRPDLAVKNGNGMAVWKDRKGISWIDPGSREYWDYIISLVRESRKVGFDEINFDYIRFPSDGNMSDISYPFSSTTPKAEVLQQFFEYTHDQLALNDGTVSPRVPLGSQGEPLGFRITNVTKGNPWEIRAGDAEHRQIVRLGGRAGENKLIGTTIQNLGNVGRAPKRIQSDSHKEKTKKKISPKNRTMASFLLSVFIPLEKGDHKFCYLSYTE